VSVEYAVRETATSLWRNRVMALAAALTVALSLFFVGAALILRQGVTRQVTVLGDNVSVQLFVDPGATSAQLAHIRASIAATPEIRGRSCTYLDHEQSYERMKSLFASDPTIVSVLTPATTPTDFECQVFDPSQSAAVVAAFTKVPGIYAAKYPAQAVQDFEKLARVLQTACLVMAIVLLVSSLALIFNAIRMAIFSRRREIGVMKLVGATNWFIRVPFMLEGFVQGLVGSALAALGVLIANLGVDYLVRHDSAQLFAASSLPSGQLLVTEIVVVAIGLGVGVAASTVAVRRFLDV
jgi:cell division transport system permease protein